jgi:ATP-dependent Lhr-like helicase
VLRAFEEVGRCQRGYFVESLGGAQFAVASTVDQLRSYLDDVDPEKPAYSAIVLAATDPANPFGAALPWPTRPDSDVSHRPGRKAGALVVLVDGELVWYLERGGKSLLNFSTDEDAQLAAGGMLVKLIGSARLGGVLIEKLNGLGILEIADTDRKITIDALLNAGFARTPRGLRMR